jgi:plasmid stabilization system protein ParE
MTLRFTPRARDDLREIVDYIAKENPAGADKVRQAISDACALIAARP